MTHLVQRSVLILLAGTALTACASPNYPITAPLVQVPPPAAPAQPAPSALAAVSQDVLPDALTPTAPVETRPLAPLALAPSSAMAVNDTEAARVLSIAPPGVDAAARAKSRRTSDSYTVRSGDTLAKIAVRMGSDVETLAKINGLKKPYRLDLGQVIKGPGSEEKAPAKASSKSGSKSRAEPAAGQTYEVRRGDTLFAIAQRLGTTVEALQAANGLGRGSSIMPGRKLVVPGSAVEAEPAVEETPPPEPKSRRSRTARDEAPVEAAGGREVTGRVVNVEVPGKAYKVRKGDTLERIARKLDSEIDDLARINRLKKPYRLQPGQTIRGPGDTAKAYVVGRGDTLAEIAQRFGVTVDKLRTANGLRRGAAVAPGRKLRLPAGYRDRGPIAGPAPELEAREPVRREPEARPGPEPLRTPDPRREPTPRPRSSFDTPPPVGQVLPPPRSATPPGALPSRPQPYTPSRPSQTYTPQGSVNGAPTASPPVSEAQIMEMGRGLFIWPVRGEVLSSFGQKSMGQGNDGLNIRANAGDPVRSAADGDVVYAGDQVPGFGNLVLVKHANGWVTAYGHLSRVAVRMQQKVSQGQEIGQAGSTGGVSEPQLHFEVRYAPSPQERARPVDPSLVLPK